MFKQQEEKKCANCFQVKPITDFYLKRFPGRPEYRQARCKVCNKEVCAAYRASALRRGAMREDDPAVTRPLRKPDPIHMEPAYV
jgi:hypothetical protein